MSSSSTPARWRGSPPTTLLIRLVTLVVAAAVLAIVPASAQADPALGAAADADKIKPQLAQQLEGKGEATFWVRFDQADLRRPPASRGLQRPRPGGLRRS